MGQIIAFLLFTWETWIESLALGPDLIKHQQLQALGSEPAIGSFCLSVCLTNR